MRPEEAVTLSRLMAGANDVVELGTFMGGSAAVILRAIAPNGGHLICIDTFDGRSGGDEVSRFDKNAQLSGLQRNLAEFNGQYSIVVGMTDVARYFDRQFDAVFIDADHSYSAVKSDIENWIGKIRPGGIICGHDYDRPSFQCDKESMIENCEMDYFAPESAHYGVIMAVDEIFGDAVEFENRIWWSGV